ncbi:MAG TPA: hypothetical protein ENN07_01605 [candidate division Zixibacteria bacterium]|nr:hypothetical protein [candidate division Zixibacteria bacterium]
MVLVIMALFAVAIIAISALYLLTFWTPLQKFAARAALRAADIDASVDFDRLKFRSNYIHLDSLVFTMTDGSISVDFDSLRADFSWRSKTVHRLELWGPNVRIGPKAETEPKPTVPSKTVKPLTATIEELTIESASFVTDGFSAEEFSYSGGAVVVGERVELAIDSMGVFLPGRGRVNSARGDLAFDDSLTMDLSIALVRTALEVRGAITSFEPFEWRFAGGGDIVDLVEVDSLLGLGFLEGFGAVRIDLRGGENFVEGDVFIDGEIFDIPARNTSSRLVFRNDRLELPNLRGSAWGSPVSARLSLDFSKAETGGGIGMKLDGTTRNFDLNAFMLDGSLPTDLTGNARIVGTIFDDGIELLIGGDLEAGSILGFPFDAAVGSLFVSPDSVRFYPGWEVLTGENFLTLGGVMVFDGEIHIEFGLWARDVAQIASWFGMEDVVGGRLRLENAEILGTVDHPILSLDIMSDSLVTAMFHHDYLTGYLTIYDLATVMHGDIYIFSEGTVGPLGYDSLLTNIRISGDRYFVRPLVVWGDTLSLKTVAEVVVNGDSVGIKVDGLELILLEKPIVLDSTFYLKVADDQISSSPLYIRMLGGNFFVEGLKGSSDRITFNAALDNLRFGDVAQILGADDIDGVISGKMFYSSEGGGTGSFALDVADFTTSGLLWDEAKAEGRLHDGMLEIEPILVARPTERYTVTGQIDLEDEKLPFSFDARGKGHRAEVIHAFIPEVDSAVGNFDVVASVGGHKDSIFVEGGFTWDSGVLGLRNMADPIERMHMDVRLEGSTVYIDSLSGRIGALPFGSKSLWERMKRIFTKRRRQFGDFSLAGSVDVSNPSEPKPDLHLKAKSLPLNFPEEGIFARAGADLHIGYGQRIGISGDIEVEYANIVQLEAGGGGTPSEDIPIDLNIVIDLPRNININTTLLESELSGRIHILTETGEIALFGDLNVVRGKVFFYGQTFRIEHGTIGFRTFEGINPELDIIAFTRVGQTRIVIHVTGDLETPRVALHAEDQSRSRLPYDERQILSILAFRTEGAFTDSAGLEMGSFIEERLPQVVQSYLSRELETVARTALGVETFEFQPSDEDVFDFSQANVTIGKYLTDKIYLRYTRSLSFDEQSEDIINLQYRITDVISIEARRETGPQAKENYRLDLKFRWEY